MRIINSGHTRPSVKLKAQFLLASTLIALSTLAAQAQLSRGPQTGSQQSQLAQALVTPDAAAIAKEKAKVTFKRVARATLSAAAIKTLRSIPVFNRAVTISDNTITPRVGSSLWAVSNGGYVLIGGGTVEPLASERFEKDMGGGYVYVATCACPNFDPNKDDGCEFDGAESMPNCKGNGTCACKFTDGLIHDNGSYEFFHQGATP
jgi:hypothetical protein